MVVSIRAGANDMKGWFLVQSIIAYTAGIKLWLNLTDTHGLAVAAANVVCLIVCFLATIVFGEIFYNLIDKPSVWLARSAFTWIKS